MKQRIESTYNHLKELLPALEQVVLALRRQDFYRANCVLKGTMARLEEVLAAVLEEQEYFSEAETDTGRENIVFLLNSFLDALDAREYVLLADILASSALPFLYALQEHIVLKELSEPVIKLHSGERNYQVEYTSCGLPTVRASAGGTEFYLHSNRNARAEAAEIAAAWQEQGKTEYIIYGMGLGYPVTALIEENEYLSVQVFECDAALLELSRRYGDYDRLLASGRVRIELDETGTAFAAAAAEKPDAAVAFFYPSLRLIPDRKAAERMEDLFISSVSQKTQYPAMCGNFERNIRHYDEPVDVLKRSFSGKRVYLIAGGPSLDKNCDLLKEAGKSGIIVAAATVLKKLLSRGIRPNYIVVSDAKANTFRQAEGVCGAGIPVWGLSTAYYRFFTDYHAKHYLVCQEDFEPAEKFAKEKGYLLVRTGGTVITAALDTALKLGAAEIIFVGLDLAFTEGRHHAENTDHDADRVYGDQRLVTDIYGNMVQTGRNLDIYRKFIERRIEAVQGVRFVDATEGGARIAGTEIMTLAQALGEICEKD